MTLAWLFPWRREKKMPAKPFAPVKEVETVLSVAATHNHSAVTTARHAIDGIEQQQHSGLLMRLIQNSDHLRSLTNDTIDRTKR